MFGCVVAMKLIQGARDVDFKSMKKDILQKDCNMSTQKCNDKAPLIAEVAERSRWPRIWDGVLKHGGRYTARLQALTRLMSHRGRGRKPCPFREDSDLDVTILEHVLESHSSQLGLNEGFSTACIVDAICTDMFSYVRGFYRVLHS